jgi:Flp pilus assembly protein TadB
VCGLRDGSGGAWFVFIKGGEKAMLLSIAVGATAVLLSLLLWTWLSFWAIICLLIGVPMFILYRGARKEAERRFAADAGRTFP